MTAWQISLILGISGCRKIVLHADHNFICDIVDYVIFIWRTFKKYRTYLSGGPKIGIWPNFGDLTQFLGFATSRTRYRGKRSPLRYYKPSRWLKTLWGMVQMLHTKLWGVQNYFLRKRWLKMDCDFANQLNDVTNQLLCEYLLKS